MNRWADRLLPPYNIFSPAGMPHVAANPDELSGHLVSARTDPNEQESAALGLVVDSWVPYCRAVAGSPCGAARIDGREGGRNLHAVDG